MKIQRTFVLPALTFFFAAACLVPETKPKTVDVTYADDIAPILQAKCVGCHSPGNIAPMSLTDYDHAFSYRNLIKQQTHDRTMPPWPPSKDCAPLKDSRALSDKQIALIQAWVDQGAVEGAPVETSKTALDGSYTALSDSTRFALASPYQPVKTPDEYRCFLFDWDATEPTFVTGFQIRPGNKTIDHHTLLFLIAPSAASNYVALDAADPKPGYECLGVGGVQGAGIPTTIGGWVPGSKAEKGSLFPVDTGLRVEPGSKILLQMHYNMSSAAAGVTDDTSFSLQVRPAVKKEAKIIPWTDVLWPLSKNMKIPAGEADVVFRYSEDPGRTFFDGKPLLIHNATLHMHLRGAQASLKIERAGKENQECVLDIPKWDFHWQGGYTLEQPIAMQPGDKMAIECHYDNRAESQPVIDGKQVPARELNWGEGTSDEMCLGFFYVTETD